MKIREFKAEDLEMILKIDRISLPKSRRLISREDALRLSKQNPRSCLVAEEKGKLIGFIFGELRNDSYAIRFLQVLPDRIGEGIVSKLIEKVIKMTKTKALIKGA